MVASLAKAFSAGGAVLVSPDVETARLVRTCGSTMIFSGPLQPALLGAAIASARVHLSHELGERQARLAERIHLFNTLCAEARGCRSVRRPRRRSASSASASRRRPTRWPPI